MNRKSRLLAAADGLARFLFPQHLRPYITFRNATVFCVVLAILNLVILRLGGLNPAQLPAEWAEKYEKQKAWVHLPPIVFLEVCLVAAGAWVIHRFRDRAEYYMVRVIIYSVLLASLLGLVMSYVV